MKNLQNQRVFLTFDGASRLFANTAVRNLPVVPTDPCAVNGTIVYGNTYAAHNGEYVGGTVSEDAVTENEPSEADVAVAVQAYEDHVAELRAKYGPLTTVPDANIAELLESPVVLPLPTLEERYQARKAAKEAEAACPRGWDHV